MIHKVRLLITIALSLAAAGSSRAAPADDIVVEARQLEAVRDFVTRLAEVGRTGQLARWDNGVCTEVIGLEPEQSRFVEGRISDAAKIARLSVPRSGCRPTALVIVTNDAAALAKAVAARYPNTLKIDGRGRLNKFIMTDRPVRWISQSDVLPGDGDPLLKHPGKTDVGRLANSRLVASTRVALTFMLVIIDGKQLGEVKLGPLADYAAMVVLTQPRFDGPPPSRSVLTLFEPSGERDGLTDRDRSYLAALYKVPSNRTAASQRDAIRNAMEHDEHAAEPSASPPH